MTEEIQGIDIHAHGVPAAFLEEMRRREFAGVRVEESDHRYVVTFPGRKPLRPVAGIMLEFKERLGWLDDQGMRHQIVAPWLDVHGQELPGANGQEWVRTLNDSMAESVSDTDGRLLAHATLHLADAEAAASELDRAVHQLGMTGCMIPTSTPDGDLTDRRYDVLWEAAESLGIPVVLHPPTVGPSSCLFGELPEFRGLYGRVIDTTITAARLIVAGVFDRFTELRLVLVHGGGFLPYQTGRFDREFGKGDMASLGSGIPSDYVKKFHYDTTLMSAPALRLLFQLVGTGRIMIGSDYAAGPTERGGPRLTDALDATGVDPETRQMVLYGTASSLFKAGIAPADRP